MDAEHKIRRIKNSLINISWLMALLFLLVYSYFVGMWVASGEITDTHLKKTLSYMIATNSEVRVLYIIWWGIYTAMNMVFIWIVLTYDISIIDNTGDLDADEDSKLHKMDFMRKQNIYIICTALYVPLSIIRLAGLLFLWLYSVIDQNQSHDVFTTFALFASILIMITLFTRRIYSRAYPVKGGYRGTVFFFNVILILAAVSLLFAFGLDRVGEIEFALALVVGADPIFQIVDYRYNIHCKHTINKHILNEECINIDLRFKESRESSHMINKTRIKLGT